MTFSVDQSSNTARAEHSQVRVLFVTDPLCSWCWGTLPEVLAARESLQGKVTFDLIMGGLQIGTQEGLLEYDVKRLNRLWQEVEQTTGQRFSHKIPEGFVYHSELSCRAVEIARNQACDAAPFEFFHHLQAAFYLEGQDINDPEVLAGLLELETEEVAELLQTPDIKQRTWNNFEYAKSLAATALPHFLIDTGSGYQLLCGGYVNHDYLVQDIQSRMV